MTSHLTRRGYAIIEAPSILGLKPTGVDRLPQQECRYLGPDYNERRDVDLARARAVHALERLGFNVSVAEVA